AGRPFYLAAIISGISRIHDNKHYPSDVIAGAGLGVAIVRGFDLSLTSQKGPEFHSLARITPGQIQIIFMF
ncbi:MAG: phosphatase PAP2 family protein, partial [Candidatus Marinimicrobia bacterium]|nr:phosphatase PAP2 family protein [Candidatus Neomarinimicrobiota bacterium]